jgi:hypothetical protein
MTLYLAEDVMKYMNPSELPENITVLSGIPDF